MANNHWRHPSNTEVAQVQTIVITAKSTAGSATWTWTLTDDDGNTYTETFTEDASPTIAEVVTGLTDAWNNSTKPPFTRITAVESGGTTITLTADTAGIPFTVTLADDADGTHTNTATTANVGDEDYGTARNWELDAVPIATNDVLFIDGAVNVKYGLNQSAVALADFFVFKGCSSQFGRFEDGLGHYLRVDPNAFEYRGNGSLAMFDIGAAAISPVIAAEGSPTTGKHTVYIKGSAIATLECYRGNIGVAPLDGDTATITTLVCGFLQSRRSDVSMTVGSGVTLTTLTQTGGTCLLKCAATTVNQSADTELTTEGTGTIGTLTARGTCYPNSSGTITTLNCHGTVDFSRDETARTVTTLNAQPGGKVVLTTAITVTTFTPPTTPGTFTIEYA